MTGPLAGIRIVECSAFIAAPLAGLTLAQLGAEVLRIDPPHGGLDQHRWPVNDDGVSLYWAGLNKGKRSLHLDMRTTEGQRIFSDLIQASGVFLTNLAVRPWQTYETLTARRADLVMAEIVGSSQGRTAIDYTVNAATGLPYMTGSADSTDPINNVVPAWDISCALTVATGLVAAIRERDITGQGRKLSVALDDVAFSLLDHLGYLAECRLGSNRPRLGNALYGSWGDDFITQDGQRIMLAAVTKRQWDGLVELTGIAEPLARLAGQRKLDFAREGDRYLARQDIRPWVASWIAARELAQLQAEFDRVGILWGVFQTMDELVHSDPRASLDNPLFQCANQPGIGAIPVAGSALAGWPRTHRAAPYPGGDGEAILSNWLGFTDVEIKSLQESRVVGGNTPP